MKNKIKKISFLFLILGLILIIGGGTYAFFNFNDFSNELVTSNGQVYLKMNKSSNNITLNNVFPETYKHAAFVNGENGTLRTDNVIEFTVIGKNEYKNSVYYEIDLEYGEDVNDKERIEDIFLQFELTDITDPNNIITLLKNKTFYSIDGTKIYVDNISNTDTNYSKTFRLRMWYNENIIISDTDEWASFRASDLNDEYGNDDLPVYTDLFASVKVSVYGDFNEKTLYEEQPASCFTYVPASEYEGGPRAGSSKIEKIKPTFLANPSHLDDEGLAITGYDTSCGFDVVIPKTINNHPVVMLGHFEYDNDNEIFYEMSSIYIPEYVEEIEDIENCIFNSYNLTNIVVDPNNTVFDSRDNCNAVIETSTNTLLYGCSNTIIPNTVTKINYDAFQHCSYLTDLYIPSSVIDIGGYSFYDIYNLTSIIVDSNNPVYDSRNNCNAIINKLTNELVLGCMNTIIPDSVTSIGRHAFYRCTSLTSIDIPNSVTSIGSSAFSGCTSLTSIDIPNSVTSIDSGAFYYCDKVEKLKIPSSISYIERLAFFSLDSLTDIYVSWTNPNTQVSFNQYSYTLEQYGKLGLGKIRLHVPSGTGNLYKNHSYFKDYTIIEDN